MSNLQLREGELERIQRNYPDKIPIFITKAAHDSVPDIKRHKFLVPPQFTMAEFVLSIRRWLLLTPEQAIFIFINNTLPMTGSTMAELYTRHRDSDGILRMTYASENTFG
jgi:GABA(A) receptor-associated protein